MSKLIIGIIIIFCLSSYDGVSTYKNVQTLSDLGSLINIYLAEMTAVILLAFGLDDIFRHFEYLYFEVFLLEFSFL